MPKIENVYAPCAGNWDAGIAIADEKGYDELGRRWRAAKWCCANDVGVFYIPRLWGPPIKAVADNCMERYLAAQRRFRAMRRAAVAVDCKKPPPGYSCPPGFMTGLDLCPPRQECRGKEGFLVAETRPECGAYQGRSKYGGDRSYRFWRCARPPRRRGARLRRLGQALGAILWRTIPTTKRRMPDRRVFSVRRKEPGGGGNFAHVGWPAALARANELMTTLYSKPALITIMVRKPDDHWMPVAYWADCGQGWVQMQYPWTGFENERW